MTSHQPTTLAPRWQDFYGQLPTLELFGAHSFATAGESPDPDHHAWLSPLHHFTLLQVEGPDAASFLQGQLTADVATLPPGATTLAAHCDPKGRMHANFLLTRRSENCYWLFLSQSVAGKALASLGKYAVFSKVELQDIGSEYFCIGFAPPAFVADQLQQDASCAAVQTMQLDNGIAALAWPTSELTALQAWSQQHNIAWQGSARWQRQAIAAGIGFVEAATSGEFIPQMLNMDCLGGISFTKGCYTGQEIIARMKYRGSVKRRCWPFRAELSSFDIGHEVRTTAIGDIARSLGAGAAILDHAGNTCGQVVNLVIDRLGSTRGLAVMKREPSGFDPAPVLQGPGSPGKNRISLAFGAPPYAIPLD